MVDSVCYENTPMICINEHNKKKLVQKVLPSFLFVVVILG